MSADLAWGIAFGLIAILFTVSLTSLPERLRRWWETDSNGEMPEE